MTKMWRRCSFCTDEGWQDKIWKVWKGPDGKEIFLCPGCQGDEAFMAHAGSKFAGV